MVRNRFDSDGIPPERPSKWIPNLSSYAAGPLSQYGKLQSNGKAPKTVSTLTTPPTCKSGRTATTHSEETHMGTAITELATPEQREETCVKHGRYASTKSIWRMGLDED